MPLSPPTLFSVGICVLIAGLLQGPIRFWNETYPVLFGAFRYTALFGLLFIVAAYWSNRFRLRNLTLNVEGFAWGLLFVFLTNWLCRTYSFVWGPIIRGEILLIAFLAYLGLRRNLSSIIPVAAALSVVLLAISFFSEASGRLLFTDDHGPVLYRLMLLKENFPNIPFYSPDWNGGFDARDFFATGILNVFIAFSPLIYAFEIREVYNLIIALVFFVVCPLSAYLGARIEGMKGHSPYLAALLALTSSLLWYRWTFKYGSMGFVMSVAMIPLTSALIVKIITPKRELTRGEAILSVVAISLSLFWPLIGVVLLPLLIAGVFFGRTLVKKRFVLGVGAVIVLIAVPWMSLFLSVSNVGTFLTLSRPVIENRDEGLSAESIGVGDAKVSSVTKRAVRGGVRAASAENSLKNLRDFSVGANPVILLLAIPALLLLPRRESRYLYGALGVWLLFLGAFVKSAKPQLELERMFVVLTMILSIPVAGAVWSLIEDKRTRLVASLTLGFLFAAVFSSSSILRNRTFEQYSFDSTLIDDTVKAISDHGGTGRTVFSGFVLHQFENGHIAPLARLSRKPLVASTPFHSVWWYTDVIPQSFRERGEEGIEEYLDLLNATSVTAHEPKWREYFRARDSRYKSVWKGGEFELFTRTPVENGYFIEGKGEILEQTSNGVKVRVDSERAVIKFNYFPFLNSSSCKISGREVQHLLTFIELSGCKPGETVLIESVTGLKRLLTDKGDSKGDSA